MQLDSTVPESMTHIPISPNFPYASMRGKIDFARCVTLSAHDLKQRPAATVVGSALTAGATLIRVEAQQESARTVTALAAAVAVAMANAGVRRAVPLLLEGYVDVAWVCRRMGIKVDGVQLGNEDLPSVQVRALLGGEAIVGLAVADEADVEAANALPDGCVDYLVIETGVAAGLSESHISALRKLSRVPVVC